MSSFSFSFLLNFTYSSLLFVAFTVKLLQGFPKLNTCTKGLYFCIPYIELLIKVVYLLLVRLNKLNLLTFLQISLIYTIHILFSILSFNKRAQQFWSLPNRPEKADFNVIFFKLQNMHSILVGNFNILRSANYCQHCSHAS